MGAQFREEMRARRSLRVFSISLRYSASTFTTAICQTLKEKGRIGLKIDSERGTRLINIYIYNIKIQERGVYEEKNVLVSWRKQSMFWGEPLC